MKDPRKNKLSGIIKNIRSGIKVIQVDKENREVKFIECVMRQDNETKPYYISLQLDQDAAFDQLLESKEFKDALFDPKDRGILLLDVAGYSRYDTLYQAAVLSLLNQAIRYALHKFKTMIGKKCLEQIVPTGDGCYIIFNECVNDYFLKVAYAFYVEMNKVQDQLNGKYSLQPSACEKMYLRYSCTVGETDFFIDPTGKRNCYGTGMNEAERVLKLGQEGLRKIKHESLAYDSFFLDKRLHSQAEELMSQLREEGQGPYLEELGTVTDKHDNSRNIYWLHDLPPLKDIEF